MASTRGDLNTRMTEILKKSETRNLTPTQRNRALNDALLTDVNHYRNWNPQYVNKKTQAVDGIIHIPYNFRKSDFLTYGSNEENGFIKEYTLVDQTRFFQYLRDQTAAITDVDDRQVLRIWDNTDQGVNTSNKTADTDLGLRDTSANTSLFQTFTATGVTKGATLNLKRIGDPSGTLTVSLFATSSSLPTGSALASGTLSINEFVDTDYYTQFFNFNYTTVVGTEYAIVLSSDYTISATDYIAWQYSTTSQISTGTRGVYDGATYATATGDMYFLVWKDKFRWQYEFELTEMTSSASSTGLSRDFDEPICMLAAARLLERQSNGADPGRTKRAFDLRYGNGGSPAQPNPESGYGLLNIIWNEIRVRTKRPFRRMENIFETRRFSRRYPNTNPTQP